MSLEKKTDKTDKTERSERNSTSTMSESMYVVKRNGEQEEVSFDKIIKRIQKYSKDLTKSNAIELVINPTSLAQVDVLYVKLGCTAFI